MRKNVQKNLLFIPGPVTVAEPILAAMAQPMIDHRGPAFAELIDAIAQRLKPIFGTKNDVVVLGSSGTGGLEAAVCSLFSPGETLLACPIGVFGQRVIAIARAFGCNVEVLETSWGEAVDPAALSSRLRADAAGRIAGILLTHNETSTGVQNDMAALAAAIGDHKGLVVVDSVSGLGASEFRMDEWNFDIVITASQKALAAPPGLSMLAVSERAWTRIESAKASRFYFDLHKAREFARLGQTPWTPPVPILFALHAAIEQYENEGAAQVWRRHARYAQAIRAAAGALGLEVFSAPSAHSQTVVALKVPAAVNPSAVLGKLREERGIVLSGGQRELKGKIFRIGTMGDLSQTDVLGALGAIEIVLLEQGFKVPIGAGVRAALEIFLEHSPTSDGRRTDAKRTDAQTMAGSR